MGTPKDDDAAPAYQELFEQRPSNPLAGYLRVAQADENDDVERYTHSHQESEPESSTIALDPIPKPIADGQPHLHCEVCDRQLERREKRRSKERICEMVSITFILILSFVMIFGIVAVVSINRKSKN